MRLYPNPAATELHLALPAGALARSLAVVDALGRTVLAGRDLGPRATLNIAALPAGLYVVRVATAGGQLTQHFLKP
ncbi:T9SS type A sorting domain-containing protein [Hymenobacter sp. PAMC 26628]|uniref:T9SS type A sorting domain-containing protein n=1 Tax=Hymenobacter sp. PAMC 26628 TaxID=1484118 RepID=UPI00214FFC9A|nr:T9SS type A sorting domain-containing protein [Hymenobacter sp. PAMC 26628]